MCSLNSLLSPPHLKNNLDPPTKNILLIHPPIASHQIDNYIQMSKLVENYLLQQPIGKGVYGQVYRAIHQKSKHEYAVKVIPKSSFKANPKLEQLAINEINILSSLRNQNIVRFIETLKTPNNFYFVYEYCNGGTLENLLQKKKNLKETEALVIFKQLLEAFKELNKNNIMHRDLKPDNIFFSDGKVKLGDFGFCKMLQVNMAQTMLGSPIYMAPEVLKEEIYTLKADIWSLGVVLFEILFGFCPFESSSISQLINIIKDTELQIPKEVNPISDECETLIRKMLVKDQFKRIQWVDLFQYKIDEEGKIVSGYKKDLAIQALEKYFLLDVKAEDLSDKKGFSYKQEAEKPKYFQSNKVISISKDNLENRDITPIKKTNINVEQQSIPINYAQKQKEKTEITQFEIPKELIKEETFVEKHSKWLRGVQLLDELADCGDSAEILFYYVIISMLKEIDNQYHLHPEWTDVLMDEKRCLSDSLRALGRDQTLTDVSGSKGQLMKLWKGGQQRWKMMWARAIRFIFNSDPHAEVEQILTS